MPIKIQEQSSPNLWCIQPLKIGCKLDIKILQAHVFYTEEEWSLFRKASELETKINGEKVTIHI